MFGSFGVECIGDTEIKRLRDRHMLNDYPVIRIGEDGETVVQIEAGKTRTYHFSRSKNDQPIHVGDVVTVLTDRSRNLVITRPIFFTTHTGGKRYKL